jgi:hypothetical protein
MYSTWTYKYPHPSMSYVWDPKMNQYPELNWTQLMTFLSLVCKTHMFHQCSLGSSAIKQGLLENPHLFHNDVPIERASFGGISRPCLMTPMGKSLSKNRNKISDYIYIMKVPLHAQRPYVVSSAISSATRVKTRCECPTLQGAIAPSF